MEYGFLIMLNGDPAVYFTAFHCVCFDFIRFNLQQFQSKQYADIQKSQKTLMQKYPFNSLEILLRCVRNPGIWESLVRLE